MRLVLEFTLLLLPARDDQSQPAHSCPVSTLALLQGTIAEPNTSLFLGCIFLGSCWWQEQQCMFSALGVEGHMCASTLQPSKRPLPTAYYILSQGSDSGMTARPEGRF